MTGKHRRKTWAWRVAVVCLALAAFAHGVAKGEDWQEGHFEIEEARGRHAWVAEPPAPDAWKPVEQPGLEDALKQAPLLKLVGVAPPPRRCWAGHRPYMVPNPDGKSWDMIYPYFNTYGGRQELVIHDFGSGETTRQVLSTREEYSILAGERIDFHMQPAFYTQGKLVFEMAGPLMFLVYEPARNKIVHGTKPFGNEVITGRAVLGDDGMIYGMGWAGDRSGFIAYRFDPKTYETKRWPAFGPPNKHRSELYRQVTMHGDWIYAGIGHRPWHVAAFNVKTEEGRLLATSGEDQRGMAVWLARVKGGVMGGMENPRSVKGIEDFDRDKFSFWLHDGKIYKKEGQVPPWSDEAAERVRGPSFNWDREFQVWPRDFKPPSPPPYIFSDSGKPGPGGEVSLKYRPAGATERQEVKALEYKVTMYPGVVKLLTEINDHVLFATDEGYGQHVFYNLKTRQIMRVGGTLSPYSLGMVRGRLYVCGYPTSQLWEYDFDRKIGLQQEASNPRRVGWLGKMSMSHLPLDRVVGGADGRVYVGGTTVGRRRTGGGFAWYDTKTGKTGGDAFAGHRIFWICDAADGRYILLSSKHGGDGQIYCWDTAEQKLIYQKAILGGGRPGPIVEALPGGLVIGHHGTGELYGLKAATGEVLWRKKVPARPLTSFSDIRRHRHSFRRGPDGHIWAFFDRTLVRIDPRDARVRAVGQVPDQGQLAFAGGGVYIARGNQLRRIEALRVQ